MIRGSLVLLKLPGPWGVSHEKHGIVIKEPYGCVMTGEKTPIVAYETKVVDVLFGSQVIKKIPTEQLEVLK